MTKHILKILSYVVIGTSLLAAAPVNAKVNPKASVSSKKTILAKKTKKNICMIEAKDIGKLKYKGKSYEDAYQKVADECFRKRNSMFVSQRKQQPDQDRQILFVESCVNNISCI